MLSVIRESSQSRSRCVNKTVNNQKGLISATEHLRDEPYRYDD